MSYHFRHPSFESKSNYVINKIKTILKSMTVEQRIILEHSACSWMLNSLLSTIAFMVGSAIFAILTRTFFVAGFKWLKVFLWQSTFISLYANTFSNRTNKLLNVNSTQLHVQTLNNTKSWKRNSTKAIWNWLQFTINVDDFKVLSSRIF